MTYSHDFEDIHLWLRCADLVVALRISDPSLAFEQPLDQGMIAAGAPPSVEVMCFARDAEHFPRVKDVGDIIRLQAAQVSKSCSLFPSFFATGS